MRQPEVIKITTRAPAQAMQLCDDPAQLKSPADMGDLLLVAKENALRLKQCSIKHSALVSYNKKIER